MFLFRTIDPAKMPTSAMFLIKELNPRRRVYVEIPKPSRVELKCSHVLSLPGRVMVELTLCTQKEAKRPMHFPFEIIFWDTKVF
jgi:hypothetical protein